MKQKGPEGRLARIGFFLGPALFLGVFLAPGLGLSQDQRSVAAVTALAATWWITTAIPIGATSLLPAALFPLLGVMSGRDVAPLYMKDLVFLFLGAFVLALGLERWNLHRRFALWTIARVGTKPTRIVLGFMIAAAFLSFWIKNTSVTLLMLPIGLAVIQCVTPDERSGPFALSLLLGMAYSSSVGGIATPVGTAPNQVFLGQFAELFPAAPEIPFGQWFLCFLPLILVYLPLGWIVLTRLALRVPCEDTRGGEAIERERRSLGPMGRGERWMCTLFVVTALLWVTRADLDLGVFVVPGWVGLLPASFGDARSFVTDATVGTFMAILTFLIPVDWKGGEFLMDWKTASSMPWEVLLLIGGGFAIAGGFQSSGLDEVLGGGLAPLFAGRSSWIVVLSTVVFMALLTEVTSNTATTAVLLPVLGQAAVSAGISPLLTMLPATVAASAAFMLPVATPPNAVVFSSRLVPAPQMARVGLWMNVLLAILITLVFQLWVRHNLGIEAGPAPWGAD